MSHLDQVLSALKNAGLTANISKCEWGKYYCEFLGHIVGSVKCCLLSVKLLLLNLLYSLDGRKTSDVSLVYLGIIADSFQIVHLELIS